MSRDCHADKLSSSHRSEAQLLMTLASSRATQIAECKKTRDVIIRRQIAIRVSIRSSNEIRQRLRQLADTISGIKRNPVDSLYVSLAREIGHVYDPSIQRDASPGVARFSRRSINPRDPRLCIERIFSAAYHACALMYNLHPGLTTLLGSRGFRSAALLLPGLYTLSNAKTAFAATREEGATARHRAIKIKRTILAPGKYR